MSTLRWLDRTMVEATHDQLIAAYGGSAGVRDEGLLEDTMHRAQILAGQGCTALAELAAAYAFGIARNCPFVSGNDRSALVAAEVFLRLNGFELDAAEDEATEVFRDLVAGDLDEGGLVQWIEHHLVPVNR